MLNFKELQGPIGESPNQPEQQMSPNMSIVSFNANEETFQGFVSLKVSLLKFPLRNQDSMVESLISNVKSGETTIKARLLFRGITYEGTHRGQVLSTSEAKVIERRAHLIDKEDCLVFTGSSVDKLNRAKRDT
mmetsp:Transcript_29380/g.44375  ORF Transcript_29380/g.44375 Transcript_29380/m.44375 type:complete len:133 (+) Transcript_29380:238-636(+)